MLAGKDHSPAAAAEGPPEQPYCMLAPTVDTTRVLIVEQIELDRLVDVMTRMTRTMS